MLGRSARTSQGSLSRAYAPPVDTVTTLLAFALGIGVVGGALASDRRTATVEIVERSAPAVVGIAVESDSDVPGPQEDYFSSLGDATAAVGGQRLGSGLMVDSTGHVVTNAHVVRAARRLRVLVGGRSFAAELVGVDRATDLALLRVDREGAELATVSLGSSDDVMLGEPIVIIGNPFGSSPTVTTGVVSAVGRTVHLGGRSIAGLLQVDAVVDAGNSGGVVVNLVGEVIGIACALGPPRPGIGFAVPAERVRRLVASLKTGIVEPAWIGLAAKPAGTALQDDLGLPSDQGAVVTAVLDGSPASSAGLRAGDVLTTANEQPVGSPEQLDDALRRRPARESSTLVYLRDGQRRTTRVKPLEPIPDKILRVAQAVLGMTLESRESEPGLRVVDVEPTGRAAARGFRAGDVIHEIDGRVVGDKTDFATGFYRALAGRQLLLLVQHGESAYYVPMSLE